MQVENNFIKDCKNDWGFDFVPSKRYELTDGEETFARKMMTDEEAWQANVQASEATGGVFEWTQRTKR